jgi:hypothetical protein
MRENALEKAQKRAEENWCRAYVTTATAIRIAETLLDKPGGYLSNDSHAAGRLSGQYSRIGNLGR